MDSEEYRKDIERKILGIIEEQLQSGRMDAKKAQEIARYVLDALHPHMTFDEIHQVLPALATHFLELSQTLTPFINEREEAVKSYVARHVNALIKEGKIEEAKNLITKALNNELHID